MRGRFAFAFILMLALALGAYSGAQSGQPQSDTSSVVAITTSGNVLRAVTDDGRVFGSSSGTSWILVGNVGAGSITGMIEKGSYLMAVTSNGNVYGSGSGGVSWAFFGTIPAATPVEPTTWGQVKARAGR